MRSALRLLLIGATVGVIASSSGCGIACTEVGYTNVLEVHLTGEGRDAVESLELCSDRGCVEGALSGSAGRWKFELFVDAPNEPELTASDVGGAVLVSTQVAVDWQETAEPNGPGCDNMATASAITLDIP